MRSVARKVLATTLIAALATINLGTQSAYLSQSSVAGWAIAEARLAKLRRGAPRAPVMLDVPDVGKAQLVLLYTRGRPTATFASERCFYFAAAVNNPWVEPPFSSRHFGKALDLTDQMLGSYRQLEFPLGSGLPVHKFWRFDFPAAESNTADLVSAATDESVVNGSMDRPVSGRYYVRPLADVQNHLAQVDSSLSCTINPAIGETTALWQREPDFARPNGGLQGVGRHLLFEVINAHGKPRLLLELTNTPLASLGLALPPATAIGEDKVMFEMVGRGAARVLSDPITPKMIDGRAYVAIDLGMDGVKFPANRHGLVGLYNRHLAFDPRSLVGFVRNISLVTGDDAGMSTPPSGIQQIPPDLFQRGLVFSGVYEDGWIAESARFRLGLAGVARTLRVRGQVPGFNPSLSGMTLEILVDTMHVMRQRLQPGDFDLRLPIPAAAGPRWIELRAEPADSLPSPDRRIASLLLRFLALTGEP